MHLEKLYIIHATYVRTFFHSVSLVVHVNKIKDDKIEGMK
jgi:hypothetical protein